MFEDLLLTILLTSIPLMLAGIGELVSERGGVLNLGVEGMMLSRDSERSERESRARSMDKPKGAENV